MGGGGEGRGTVSPNVINVSQKEVWSKIRVNIRARPFVCVCACRKKKKIVWCNL